MGRTWWGKLFALALSALLCVPQSLAFADGLSVGQGASYAPNAYEVDKGPAGEGDQPSGDDTTDGDISSGEGAPDQGDPGEGTPGEGDTGEGTPGEGDPDEGIPGEDTPGEGTPGEGTSGEDTPEEDVPGAEDEVDTPAPDDEQDATEPPASSEDEKTDDKTAEDTPEELSSKLTNVSCPLASGKYVIQSALAGGRVLDIQNGSSANASNVQLWGYNATAAQSFKVAVGKDGWCTISNSGSGKLLDVAWGKASPGANVHQYKANGSAAQKWRIISNSDGSFTLESAVKKGLVLDVYGANNRNGANVQLYTSNGTKAQKFVFHNANPGVAAGSSIEEGTYLLQSVVAPGKNVDINSASLSDGAPAQIYHNNATFAQMMRIEATGGGFYALRALHSGKVLDVIGGGILPGTGVQQWSFGASNQNQKWAVKVNEDKTLTFISKTNGLALDVRGGGTGDGTPLQTYTQNGSKAQKWTLKKVDSILKDGIYDIRSNLGSRRVLDVASCSPKSGASIWSWSWNGTPAQRFKISGVPNAESTYTIEALCSGMLLTQKGSDVVQTTKGKAATASQQWMAVPAASGGIAFINKASGLALDVYGAGDYNGCNIGVYAANGTAAQSFVPEATGVIGGGTYTIRSKADGRVLDVSGGSRADGANVQTWAANNTGAQAWKIRSIGSGWYTVVNARSEKALDVRDRGTKPGTNVQQWEANSNNIAQKWRIEYAGNGGYRFVSACGNLCLDVTGAGGYNGCNVQTYTKNETSSQSFRLTPTTYVKEKTLGSVLGVSRESVVRYLESHAHDNYYLGSRYPIFEGDFGPGLNMHPNGDPGSGGYVGMNCAGFVAHAVKSAGGNTNVVQRYGALCGASYWYDCARAKGVAIYSYRSINELLADGQMQKGDLIYFYPSSWSISGADTHIGFFWGDGPFSNRFWHSNGQGNHISGITGIISSNAVYLIKM